MSAKNFVYLDNASTSYPKPDVVYETVSDFFRKYAVNPGRGNYELSVRCEKMIEETRFAVAKFFGVKNPSRLIFTLNATDSLNIAIKGFLNPGDHVVITTLEHNAVLRPIDTLASQGIIKVTQIAHNEDGFVEPSEIEKHIKKNTKLVIFTHASNVFGVVQDIKKVGEICKKNNIKLLVDASQTAGHIKIDVEKDQINMLAFSGHKALYGPPGTGCLYVKEGVDLKPWREGGVAESGLASKRTTQLGWPFYLEAGTPNTVGIVGLGTAVKFVNENFSKIKEHGIELTKFLIEELKKMKGIRILGSTDLRQKLPVISFIIEKENWSAQAMSMALDKSFNIAVRGGEHCAPLVHRDILSGTLRVSPGFFNTKDDIEYFIKSLKKLL